MGRVMEMGGVGRVMNRVARISKNVQIPVNQDIQM